MSILTETTAVQDSCKCGKLTKHVTRALGYEHSRDYGIVDPVLIFNVRNERAKSVVLYGKRRH